MLCSYKKYTKAGEKKENVYHFVIMVYLQDTEPSPVLSSVSEGTDIIEKPAFC